MMFKLLLISALCCSMGCASSFMLRSKGRYQEDTYVVLENRTAQIKRCYEGVLAKDQTVSGDVVVQFKVAEESGKFIEAKVDDERSSAPAEVKQCVLDAFDDLALEPPDARGGVATFSWRFSPPEA